MEQSLNCALMLCAAIMAPQVSFAAMPDAVRAVGMTQPIWDRVERVIQRVAADQVVSERALEAVAEKLGSVQAAEGYCNIGPLAFAVLQAPSHISEFDALLSAVRRSNDDPAVRAQIENSRQALQAGDFEAAVLALISARQLFGKYDVMGGSDDTSLDKHKLFSQIESALLSAEAEVELLRADFLRSATLFADAAKQAPASEDRWRYLMDEAQAFEVRGEWLFLPDSIHAAIRIYEDEAGPLALASQRPGDWVHTQVQLGVAFANLGSRGDVVAEAKAVEAFKSALQHKSAASNDDWYNAAYGLSQALELESVRAKDIKLLAEAEQVLEVALAPAALLSWPTVLPTTETNVGRLLERLGDEAAKNGQLSQPFYDKALIHLRAAQNNSAGMDRYVDGMIASVTKKRFATN